jgi:hypothetical protein
VILAVLATFNAFNALAALKTSLESMAVSGPLYAFLGDVTMYRDVRMYSNDVRMCSDIDLLGNLNCVSYQTGEGLLVQNLDCPFDSHKE